ncbi:ECF transporter S component [Caldisericum exile]|uniref:Riboflavin transporter n=1 Tax=Caldisericum exile (strain DSM 21853 / NBRC 104410 / AZM16c01) TaxID=511051 RepID=A0A7U6JG89_CALEA|nr:ECF transporter S component [Caldisericum exile]BAL81394.1 putative riboflavin transporter [Caldisericum exile AZM16c01]
MSWKNLRSIIFTGILAALSFVLMRFTEFPLLPQASFLKTDLGDIPLLVGAYFFGPITGIAIAFIKDLLFFVSGAGQGGPIGVLLNFIATGTFALVVGIVSLKKKNNLTLLLGLILGTITFTLMMIPANLWAIPKFLPSWTKEQILNYIYTINIPFNLLKGLLDTVVTFLVVKPLQSRRIFSQTS